MDDILKVYKSIVYISKKNDIKVLKQKEFLKKISPVLLTALFLCLSILYTHTHIHKLPEKRYVPDS